MKRTGIILAFVIIFGVIIFAFYRHTPVATTLQQHFRTPTPTVHNQITPPKSEEEVFCDPSALQAHISLEGAAGSIYGTLTLKNTTNTPCQIIGNNKLQTMSSAKNITLAYEGEGQEIIHLAPQQTVYSQVHYPNGPQCNGPVKNATITFMYALSPTHTITFTNDTGASKQNIAVCNNDIPTQVMLWSFSTTPFQ